MRSFLIRVSTEVFAAWLLLAGAAAAQGQTDRVDPESASGLDYYAQGGVVVNGVAYFTAADQFRRPGIRRTDDFPSVVAFDVRTFRKLKTYPFSKTYDSSPLVVQTKDGAWLVIAHEHLNQRTVARNRDTGDVAWVSAANQPGRIFFGYSYYRCKGGSRIILAPAANGLHAMSAETGQDLWWVQQRKTHAVTPCVDQERGWVFYQCDGKVLKIRVQDGKILKSVGVAAPNRCMSWNTVLAKDAHGYFVATRWYGKPEWDSAIRVYDQDLRLIWERKDLPVGKKSTLTYAEGKLVVGGGNCWSQKYEGDAWKRVVAYAIATGRIAWECDASEYQFTSIMNVPYYNGYFYAETQNGPHASQLLRIRASDGEIVEVLDYGRPVTSCATCIIGHGNVFSGDLHEDRVVVTKIAEGSSADWPGPFGDPQTNQMALPHEPQAKLVPMRELTPDGFRGQFRGGSEQ